VNLKLFGRVVVEIFNYQGGQLGIAGPRPRLDRAPVPRVSTIELLFAEARSLSNAAKSDLATGTPSPTNH